MLLQHVILSDILIFSTMCLDEAELSLRISSFIIIVFHNGWGCAEHIDPLNYTVCEADGLLKNLNGKVIDNQADWQEKISTVRENINWALGDEPPSIGPGIQPDYMRSLVVRPL